MSREITLETEKTKLEKTFWKKMGKRAEDFIQELEGMDKKQLEAKMLGYAKHRQAIQNTKNGDAELQEAKDRKSALEAPYRDQLKENNELSRYVAILISSKFGDADMDRKTTDDTQENEE